jgi:hypothetical protein
VCFSGGERSGCGVDHTSPSGAEVKERVELYLCSPLWPFMACYRVNFDPYYEGELDVTSCTLVDGQIFTEEYLHVSGFWSRRCCPLSNITLTCYCNTVHWSVHDFFLSEVEFGVQGHRPISVNVTDLRSLTSCSLAARLGRLRVPPCYQVYHARYAEEDIPYPESCQ